MRRSSNPYLFNKFRLTLREWSEDILPLAERLMAGLSRRKTILGFTDEAAEALRRYAWPGNVRELRNVIERTVILCQGGRIGLEHLSANFSGQGASPAVGDLVPLGQIEEQHIRRVLAATRSLEDAARVLGLDPATLWRKRKKYGL
ncbi:MAG: hypothetical protein EXS64_06725 [Candidatus Latescibacteria bacterium]|nr:hypothetical protein [Candidatus Latescibacterota bacterium]